MIVQTGIVLAMLAAGVAFFELLARLTKVSKVVIRKMIHVGMALMSIAVGMVFGYRIMIVAALVFALVFVVARKTYRFQSVRDRSDESWGEVFFPLGVATSALLAPTQMIYTVALLILAFSDTAAFVVGKKFIRSKKIMKGRNVAGSGAGFLVSLIVLLLFGVQPVFGLIAASAVSVAEVFSKNGFDNFAMPVVAVMVLSGISVAFK